MDKNSDQIRVIMHKIISTTYNHRKIMDYHLEETGIYSAQHQLIMAIARNQFASQKEIAEKMRVSTAAIATSLKKLEKGGYITKEMDCTDNRLNQITLTEKGKEIVSKSRDVFKSVDGILFEDFTEEEKDTLISLLNKLDKNILRMEESIKNNKERKE